MLLKNNKLLSDYTDFGDKRLNARLGKICNQMSKGFGASIPSSSRCRSEMKGIYRFFKNKKVSMQKIIEGHRAVHQKDRDKVLKQTLLIAQDSTTMDYTRKRSAQNFGPICYKYHRGFILHNSMVISSTGVPIGLFKQTALIRSDESLGTSYTNRVPIEEKESYRWIEHFEELQNYYAPYPNIEVFNVCDREADIYELFCKKQAPNVHLIVRSQHNRKLLDKSKLHQKVASSPVQCNYRIKVTDRETGKKRKAQVALRFCQVELKLHTPKAWQKELPSLSLSVLQVEETNPPKGKKGVKWILLSTKPIKTISEAKTIIRYYELRWLIERFHYILKSGGQVTKLQLKDSKRILNAVSTYSVSAINLMRMNYLAREHPELNIYQAGVSSQEYRILYLYVNKNMDKRLEFKKDDPPSIREYVIVIARLGGFMKYNSKNSVLPGLKTFWRGWIKYEEIKQTYYTFMSRN